MTDGSLEWWLAPPTRAELHKTRGDLVAVLLAVTKGAIFHLGNDQAEAMSNLSRAVTLIEEMVAEEDKLRRKLDE